MSTLPQLPVSSDVETMFNTNELAQTCTTGARDFAGIYTAFFDPMTGGMVLGAGAPIWLIVQRVDIIGISEGDAVTVGDLAYTVAEIENDNANVGRLRLEADLALDPTTGESWADGFSAGFGG